jgi:hypothetical protein
MPNVLLNIKRQLENDRNYRGRREMVQVKSPDLLELIENYERMLTVERLEHTPVNRNLNIERLIDAIKAVFHNESSDTVQLIFAETIAELIRNKREKSRTEGDPISLARKRTTSFFKTEPTPPAPRNIGEDKRSQLMCNCKNCRYTRKHGGHMICLGK